MARARASPIGVTLTVSGLTRSGFAEAAIEIQAASGYVAWGDVPALNEAGVHAMDDSVSPADAVRTPTR